MLLLFSFALSTKLQAQSATCGRDSFGLCIISEAGDITVNSDCFYPMYSIVKFPQALYVADKFNKLGINLDSCVVVKKDLLIQDTWSPMLKRFGEEATFSIRELLHFSLVESDNNACDLLFQHCGMPELVNAYLKEKGFKDIQIVVSESQMHDTPSLCKDNCCTPKEMARILSWFYEHKDDTPELLAVWEMMAACQTGMDRIPAAVPAGCEVVHKTGTGPSNNRTLPPMNDAGIVIFPDGNMQVIAVFVPKPDSASQLARVIMNNSTNGHK